jgi:acetyl esterase/lipase
LPIICHTAAVAWLSRVAADVCRRYCNQRIGSIDEQRFEDGKVIRSVRDETLTLVVSHRRAGVLLSPWFPGSRHRFSSSIRLDARRTVRTEAWRAHRRRARRRRRYCEAETTLVARIVNSRCVLAVRDLHARQRKVDPRSVVIYGCRYQMIARDKIGRIRSPILIVQGDQHPINRFNREVLIPELQSARKALEVITYPGEAHCFAFGSSARSASAALKAFQDTDTFFRRHLNTQPKPLDPTLTTHVPLISQ